MTISRHDSKGRYYQVRVQRDCELYTKAFSDSKHGGKRGALKAARAFEAELLALSVFRPQNSVTPNPGRIYRATKQQRAERHDVLIATIRVAPRKTTANSFSIAKHGLKGARKLAEQWLARKQAEQRKAYA